MFEPKYDEFNSVKEFNENKDIIQPRLQWIFLPPRKYCLFTIEDVNLMFPNGIEELPVKVYDSKGDELKVDGTIYNHHLTGGKRILYAPGMNDFAAFFYNPKKDQIYLWLSEKGTSNKKKKKVVERFEESELCKRLIPAR